MKKIIATFITIAMIFSALCLNVFAAGEKALTMSLAKPATYDKADKLEMEDFADTSITGVNKGDRDPFHYVYLKNPDGADNPHVTGEFSVSEDGVYGFCLELMANAGTIPRTALVQVDNGEKYYIKAEHGDRDLVSEYWTGIKADLKAGKHTFTLYLADDFDNSTVKSIFLDRVYFTKIGVISDMSLELPEKFNSAIKVEMEAFADTSIEGVKVGEISTFHYTYLKKPDLAVNPFVKAEFSVDTDEKYDFAFELYAAGGDTPRSGLIQIDNGDFYYLNTVAGTRKDVSEYWTGVSADLKAGKHTVTLYLAGDFDNKNTKSFFLDRVYVAKQVAEKPAETGDTMVLVVILAVVALAGAFAVKKVRK